VGYLGDETLFLVLDLARSGLLSQQVRSKPNPNYTSTFPKHHHDNASFNLFALNLWVLYKCALTLNATLIPPWIPPNSKLKSEQDPKKPSDFSLLSLDWNGFEAKSICYQIYFSFPQKHGCCGWCADVVTFLSDY